MNAIRNCIACAGFAALALLLNPARAGDGFPPFGAWAYGTGTSAYHGRHPHWHGHHSHWRHFHRHHSHWHHPYRYHRGFYPAPWTFSSAASPFFAIRVRTHHYGFYHPYYYPLYYPAAPYIVSRATYQASPDIYFSSGWNVAAARDNLGTVADCGCTPICTGECGLTVSTSGSSALPEGTLSPADLSFSGVANDRVLPGEAVLGNKEATLSGVEPVLADELPLPPVAFSSRVAYSPELPVMQSSLRGQLIDAADAILKAGGFREAATAYAQLSIRYGQSPDLLVRRFVANVLARDFEQAEVIISLVRLAEQDMLVADLGDAGLTGLLESPVLMEAATEALAARALARRHDPIALHSIGTWLALTGDFQRSELFIDAAESAQPENSFH